MRTIGMLAVAVSLAGCASGSTIQTSADTAIVQASAAPACGGVGAAKVAQMQAAKATLKAGFDRYIIMDAASSNNVQVSQMPGTYHTTANRFGNTVYANTTYQPGATIVSGGHDASFSIKMFREGQPGAEMAIPARPVLGPEWAKEMNRQTLTCG